MPQLRRRSTYAAVLAAAVACYAALGAVLRVIPGYLAAGLGANPVWVGLAVGAPALTGAVLRPVGGRLADRHGPRAVMVGGAVAMAVGSVPAFAPSLTALLASRLLVGVGEAVMMSAAVLWLLRLAGPARQALALGHIGLANYLGLTLGPLLAGPLGGGRHPAGVWLASVGLPLAAAAGALRQRVPDTPDPGTHEKPTGTVWRHTWRPGTGLLLVNVGYVALLAFGEAAAGRRHLAVASVVIPVFAAGVIVSRTLLGSVPDRVGPARTLAAAAVAEGAGLAGFAVAGDEPTAAAALVVLSVGQGLAVPSLGALALRNVASSRRGAAAGSFFAFFDAGVGLGGPFAGTVAHVFSASAALVAAGGAVTASVPVTLWRTRRPGVPAGKRSTAQSATGPVTAARRAVLTGRDDRSDTPPGATRSTRR